MKHLLLFLIFFFINDLYSTTTEKPLLPPIQTSINDGFVAPPPATFTHKELSSFLPKIPKVNVITGEYHEEELDFVVAGIEPLSIRRFYNHLGHKNQAYGHWSINPEALMLFNFSHSYHNHPLFAGAGEENGNFIKCEKRGGNKYVFEPNLHKNFTHIGRGHPLNYTISCEQITPGRKEKYWLGEIKDGKGGIRKYQTEIGLWSIGAPAYQAFITEERKPNGNIIRYTYEDFNHKRKHVDPDYDYEKYEGRKKKKTHRKRLDTYYILRTISAYSANNVFLGSIDLNYPDQLDGTKTTRRRFIHRVEIGGSDKRKATYLHQMRKVCPKTKNSSLPIYDVVLKEVKAPAKPTQSYEYYWERAKYYYDHLFMFEAGDPNGRTLKTTYDFTTNKVLCQQAPVGPNGTFEPIATYTYHDNHTVVTDGEGHKTLYRFNDDKRIFAIEKYDGNTLRRVEKSTWNSQTGNLVKKEIEDGNGHLLHQTTYTYDKNHNPITIQTGDGTLTDTIVRTYSKDGFNLILSESTRPGKITHFTYVPNTNLPLSKLTYVNNHLVKRVFYTYDEAIPSFCTKITIDDGHSKNPDDLSGVTYRKISEKTPKRELPCIGLPEEIQEKTINSLGQEVVLKKVRYTYHPSGKIAQEAHFDATNTHRYTLINTYDENERLLATTDALGATTTFTYDDNFNLLSEHGPLNARKEYAYDTINRPTLEKQWQNADTPLTTHKTYDKCSRLLTQTDPCGCTTHYTYNGLGHLIEVLHPDGALEKKEYNALGHLIKEVNPLGETTRKTVNFRGQPLALFYPDGREEHYTYHQDSGTLATHIDPAGTKTVYTYDAFDHLIQTDVYAKTGELIETTSATYSPFHKLSDTDALGITTHYTYDFAGRLTHKQVGNQHTSYTYDALGHLTHTREGDVISIDLYDVKGQVLEKRIEDACGTCHFKETYTYDKVGNCTATTTCNGTSKTSYDALGAPTQKIDPLGHITTITYSHKECFTKTTTDPKNRQTIEIHNARGRVIDHQVKNPQGQLIQRQEKTYDKAGNQTHLTVHVFEGTLPTKTITHKWVYGPSSRLEKFIEAGQKTTSYLYDKAGRVKTLIKPNAANIHSTYDAKGRLLHYHGEGLNYLYTYDAKGRVINVFDQITCTTTKRFYDIYDNIIEEHLANGLVVRRTFAPFGKNTALYLPDNSQVTFTYQGPYLHTVSRNGSTHTYQTRNLAGKPTQIILPTQKNLTITYDPLLRLHSINSPHYRANCTYDAVGNLTDYSYQDPLGPQENHYHYDDLNQLTSENDHHYHYDSLFNRTSKNNTPYTLNTLCQITHDGKTPYEYDDNGNLTFDGTTTYEYDLLDRLIATTTNHTRTTYTYDPFNRRLSKNDSLYLWDNKNEIGAYHQNELKELRLLGEGLGAEIGSAILLELQGTTYIPLHDIQGSLIALLSIEGIPQQTHRYTAFGEPLTNATLSPWRFSSKRHDPETNLIYFGRRYYNPTLGRWITKDPQGFVDGPNLYAYVHNSPITTLDLHGLFSWASAWTGVKNFGSGAWDHSWGMVKGAGHLFANSAEWIGADCLYEMGERSHFHAKSLQSYSLWNSIGSAMYNDPLGTTAEMLAPGVMATWREPLNAENWGKATVDVALIGLSATKLFKPSLISRTSTLGKGGKMGRAVERISLSSKGITACKRGAENVNASVHLQKKLSQLEAASAKAVRLRVLPDGRIRYYEREVFSAQPGLTRGRSYVTELNPKTRQTRTWMECYNQSGKVNRVHPKQINGQELSSPHYPPTAKELLFYE